MSEKSLSAIPITKRDMDERLKDATGMLKRVSRTVTPEIDLSDPSAFSKRARKKKVSVSIMDLIDAIETKDDILSGIQFHVLRAIRGSFQVAEHVASDYSDRSGVPVTVEENMTPQQKTEMNEKVQTASAIALFVMARYIIWNLHSHIGENAFLGNVGVTVDEVDLSRVVPALQCSTFFLGKNIEQKTHGDDHKLIAVVHGYAEALQQEVINRMGSLKFTNFFTDLTYQLENSDFVISGFDVMELAHETVEINEIYPEDVIGNSTAVDPSVDVLRKIFLYDPVTMLNPMSEFGGIQSVQLLSGDPGNGKSLILAMIRTLARDYAEASGLPYQDLVVPNMVSKMQGESTDFAKEFLRRLLDPRTINIGIGDELEAFMPDHGSENVSEGDKKVAVEFLKALSGVSSMNRLNFLFFGATNYPENVDKAFMSRVKSKHHIIGAETLDDYIRFIVLNLRKLNKQYPTLVNLKGVDWDMDTRAPRILNSEAILIDPTMSVTEIHAAASEKYDSDDIRFFACFFYMMKLRQKTFSLRDCANIVDGTKSHVSGFEIPLELITEQKHYIVQPLENKRGLISELATQHVNESGINFVEMLNQQAVYYAKEALRMAETKRQREIEVYTEKRLVSYLGDLAFKEKLRLVI